MILLNVVVHLKQQCFRKKKKTIFFGNPLHFRLVINFTKIIYFCYNYICCFYATFHKANLYYYFLITDFKLLREHRLLQ